MLELIRQNPIPSAMAAVGIGWLWMQRSNASRADGSPLHRSSYAQSRMDTGGGMIGQAQDIAGGFVGQAQEKTGQLAGTAQDAAGQMQDRAKTMARGMTMDPIAIGTLGLAVGAVAALLLPETEKERQLMGEARDQFTHRVQEMGGETLEKVQRAATEVGKAAMHEAKAQGLTQEDAGASPA